MRSLAGAALGLAIFSLASPAIAGETKATIAPPVSTKPAVEPGTGRGVAHVKPAPRHPAPIVMPSTSSLDDMSAALDNWDPSDRSQRVRPQIAKLKPVPPRQAKPTGNGDFMDGTAEKDDLTRNAVKGPPISSIRR